MGAWAEYNPNPKGKRTGDCTARAICKATGQDWDSVYCAVCAVGFSEKEFPSTDSIWGAYLRSLGFRRRIIPDTCPDCYTVRDFTLEHPAGTYILGTGHHAVCVKDGRYWDAWDSGEEIPVYYWEKV